MQTIKMSQNIILILDESGSMCDLTENTLGMVNNFINDQKNKNPNAILSLFLFNNNMREIYKSVNIQNVPKFTDYHPGGPTALYDTVGNIIVEHSYKYNVTMLIVTDGEDNSSRLYTQGNVANFVNSLQKERGWQFLFFGANREITQIGQNIGMNVCQTFDATPNGIDELSQQMSDLILLL